jgi:hypothetical protein
VSHFAQAAKAESAGHHSQAVELARQSLKAAREAFPAEDGLVVALAWFGGDAERRGGPQIDAIPCPE